MAVCATCHQEMRSHVSCWQELIEYPNGKKLEQIPVNENYCTQVESGQLVCGDCSAPLGGFHHPGCDCETCPNCHGQLISCECFIG